MARCGVAFVALTIIVHMGFGDNAQDLAKNRFFHVTVEGVVASATGEASTTQLTGKAFAITSDVLVTARHVVGSTRLWWNKGTPGGVAIPDRLVTVSWMDDYRLGSEPKSSSDFYVTSSPVETADVATLAVPQSVPTNLATFELNTEHIDTKASYHVLLVEEQPSDSDSITRPTIVTLKPVRHSHIYHGMYLFETSDTVRQIERGDSGSPVLDDEGAVVGLISGNTQEGQVLVTLASWFERSSLMLDRQIRIQEREIADLRGLLTGVMKMLPSGAVLAFNLEQCPEPHWKEYQQAYGRFVRGIDKSGNGTDPDGKRAPGSIQHDQFAAHTHERPRDVYDAGGGDDAAWVAPDRHFAFGYSNPPPTGATGGSETRPDNVALLYCEKK